MVQDNGKHSEKGRLAKLRDIWETLTPTPIEHRVKKVWLREIKRPANKEARCGMTTIRCYIR